MGGTLNRNLKMFQKLCGVDALKNVIVVTTRWDDVQEKDREATERREEELMKTEGMFFEPIIAAGGRFLRHDNTIESARKIMDQLVDNEPIPLRIQIEMRDGKKVEETAAGIELRAEMNKLIEKHTNEMKDLLEEMEEAIAEKDEELRKELEAEQTRLRKDMEKWESEKKRLAGDLDSVLQATVVAREEAERQIGQQRNEYLRKVQELEKKQKGPMDLDNTGHRLEKLGYSKNTVDRNNPALEAERQMGQQRDLRKGPKDRMSKDQDDTGRRPEYSENTVAQNNRTLEAEREMPSPLEYSKNTVDQNNRALEAERRVGQGRDKSLRKGREAEEKEERTGLMGLIGGWIWKVFQG
jgi:hypothetical protein